MKEFEKLQALAERFLNTADELNELVSAYFDGSYAPEAEAAQRKVKQLSNEFALAYARYYDEPADLTGFAFEIAESIL